MNTYNTAHRMDPNRKEHRQRRAITSLDSSVSSDSSDSLNSFLLIQSQLLICIMMVVMLQARPAKRRKLSVTTNANTNQDEEVSSGTSSGSSALGGIEDHQSESEDDSDDEDDPKTCQKEEALLDDVLAIYDKYEEDALVEQNRLRCKLTTCSMKKAAALQAQLSDAKIKCSLLKVLTLLLQSDSSRFKGRLHADRMELMQQVEGVLLNINLYCVNTLKRKFVLLFASLRRDLFPPSTIVVPSSIRTLSNHPCSSRVAMDQQSLNRETILAMSQLEDLAKKHLQQRLASIMPSRVGSEENEQDWESMREVWNVWLQFPASCHQQFEIWQETLSCNDQLSSLLWNLAYYLSLEDSVDTTAMAC